MPPRVKLPPGLEGKTRKDFKCVSLEYLQHAIQDLGLKSVREYYLFHKTFKPAGYPRQANRYYGVKWKVIFGGNNIFSQRYSHAVMRANLTPFDDAVALIQPMQFTGRDAFLEAFDAGKIPKGIPRQPQDRYAFNWARCGGWFYFLGKDIKYRLEAAKNVKPLLILYKNEDRPGGNVINIMIYRESHRTIGNMAVKQNMEIVKIYKWNPDVADHVFAIFNTTGTQQTDTCWMFSNVFELYYELSSVLDDFKPGL